MMYMRIGTGVLSASLNAVTKSAAETFRVPMNQFPRVFFHSVILAMIIAGFWTLDSFKDPILSRTVGMENQPLSKLMSVICTVIIVSFYDFLTSTLSKPNLFLAISGVYGTLFFLIAALLSDHEVGLDNKVKDDYRILGYISYIAIESYGSLMVALFWSFTNSTVNLELAKGAYGLIICLAQVGAISGATIATRAETIGIPILYMLASMSVFMVGLLIKVYFLVFRDENTHRTRDKIKIYSEQREEPVADTFKSTTRRGSQTKILTSDDNESNNGSNKSNSKSNVLPPTLDRGSSASMNQQENQNNICHGFVQGLLLISRYRYTWYLLGVSTLYEVVLTILDYEFKLSGESYATIGVSTALEELSEDVIDASSLLTSEVDVSQDKFAHLLGRFGQLTNFVALFLSLFGFSYVVHKLGVTITLLIFPCMLFFGVVINNLVSNMWVLFVLLSILKAITFSLNEPVKELLYMPTSDAIKYKAKAWIDVFGARCAKAFGSFITNLSGGDLNLLRKISEIPVIILSIFYLLLVYAIAKDFEWLQHNERIVGEKFLPTSGTLVSYEHFPERNGLKPGDVGYDGYTDIQAEIEEEDWFAHINNRDADFEGAEWGEFEKVSPERERRIYVGGAQAHDT